MLTVANPVVESAEVEVNKVSIKLVGIFCEKGRERNIQPNIMYIKKPKNKLC